MIVKIYWAGLGEVREAGRLRLDGAGIRLEPATPEDRPLLENILKEPILIGDGRVPVWIHADLEPQRFLENLSREYSGSYLWASQPEKAEKRE